MITMRRLASLLLLVLLAPAPALAQNSIYGVAGIGFPEEPISVHARGLGGGNAAFDALSALNPAAAADFGRLAASVTMSEGFRSYTAGDTSVSGLRETRFPFGLMGGKIGGTPLSFAVSYATYAERTFDVRTTGTQVLRGDTLSISDKVASNGAVTDVRGAIATRPLPFLKVGAAIHLLGGSSRLDVQRTFSDSAYLPYAEASHLIFSGVGVSAGVVLRPVRAIELAGAARVNGPLSSQLGNHDLGSVALPVALTGGLRLAIPRAGVSWSSTATWQSWSRAGPDLVPPTRAFDTWDLSSGIELHDRSVGGGGLPLRVGVRYRQLPFSNLTTQPTELALAAGSGLVFAQRRAELDFSLEHVQRTGGGADERGWQIAVGIVVLP
jgi:hypothetical protein